MVQRIAISFILLLLTASTLFAGGDNAKGAVIFMYHRFGDDRFPSTNVKTEQFLEQLDYFKKNDFKIVALDLVIDALKSGTALPDKSVVLTVDDAYLSVYEVAYPIVKKHGVPLTVFVSTDVVDDGLRDYMTWEQMREMQANGVSFANHGSSHARLHEYLDNETSKHWVKRVEEEIVQAGKRLTEELGVKDKYFAYPYGEYNLHLMEIVERLGYVAFGQHSGAVGELSDLRSLPRFPVNENYAEMSSFKTKAHSLPMPVAYQDPIDPQTTNLRPLLRLELNPTKRGYGQFACYFEGELMELEWREKGHLVEIVPVSDLSVAHSRYNCTSPSEETGRYYWYSHPWLLKQ